VLGNRLDEWVSGRKLGGLLKRKPRSLKKDAGPSLSSAGTTKGKPYWGTKEQSQALMHLSSKGGKVVATINQGTVLAGRD